MLSIHVENLVFVGLIPSEVISVQKLKSGKIDLKFVIFATGIILYCEIYQQIEKNRTDGEKSTLSFVCSGDITLILMGPPTTVVNP